MGRAVGLIRSSKKCLLIRSLEFNLRAVTFGGEHYRILICILEVLLQLQCEGCTGVGGGELDGCRRVGGCSTNLGERCR